ncbi:CHL4 Inner kinetochore subunit CHL4 [Candida maltosa Xu316]
MTSIDVSTRWRKNVLPSTYIPVLDKSSLFGILDRANKKSVIRFIILWTRLKNTQPKTPSNYTQNEFNNKILREVKSYSKEHFTISKRFIIEKVIHEYWSQGLNLLQISQIDCQLIVDNSVFAAQSWIYSTVKDMHNDTVPISINPQHFLQSLADNLSTLYTSYTYICKHPRLPVILIRIQVFDLNVSDATSKPHISSHRAQFFGVLVNSPHIIHSSNNESMIHKIVMESFERSLPQNRQNLLRLETPKNQFPIKSLDSMNILKGNNRHGNSLGIWTPYADGTVDMLPLGALENHQLLKKEESDSDNDDEEVEDPKMIRLKKIANLRFKGTVHGNKQLDHPQQINNQRKRKRKSDMDDDEGWEFCSMAPIQFTEFVIKEHVDSDKSDKEDNTRTSIRLKLSGSDVFGGMHELSVKSVVPEEMIVNPEEMPNWLTGEEGSKLGEIIDGQFIQKTD